MRPMLATPATALPTGEDWLHEVKWDGMRVLADVRDGRLTLTSRAGNDATASFPELAGLADLYDDMLLDGEVVALDGGRPSFGALAERMHVRDRRKAERLAATRPVTFMVFDLLRLYGSDLTGQPLSARRELLERLDLDGRHWQVPPVYDDGQELFDATLEQGLEGVVSKRRSSPYLPGRRSADWLKSPHRATHSVVVGGWRPEQTNDSGRLGAILVGTPDGAGGWAFLGRVGSGIAGRAATLLAEEIGTGTIPHSPFSTPVPRVDAVGTTWVEPRLVVEVRALEVTRDGRLRQPAYLGVRPDLTPADLQEVDGA
ncbi:non-homologous end-joining DNA ligase [Phycicoccus sp. M110.8]|uniref:non-homologous end-joining DNA ligase n=1 Tax=Phycicoccus sp. M110.8 TaxID=3075433 RepID=UPI0028FD7F1C|nr:non-homologous end-joining DNA ligase [Phycicoccus sp. M110.8]MDU0314214.1 non-homologous end-joining DNA ligase [Phycicoccus sp. M110.8]HET8769134.1 non-homologous end-joining DNA ligase [Pedococcus sp.]